MKAIYLLIISIVLLSSFSLLNSQEYVFGISGGLNRNTIGVIESKGTGYDVGDFEGQKDISYQIGGYFMAEWPAFFIRPELNYVSIENHYEFPRRDAKWTTSKLEIPLLIGLKIAKPVAIYAGPGFNFFDDYQLEGVQAPNSYSDGGPDLDKTTTSLNFGIMARYNRFVIDLRYEVGTKEQIEGDGTEAANYDINHSEFGVNLADARPYTPKMLRLSLSIDIFRTDGTSIADIFRKKNCYGCPY